MANTNTNAVIQHEISAEHNNVPTPQVDVLTSPHSFEYHRQGCGLSTCLALDSISSKRPHRKDSQATRNRTVMLITVGLYASQMGHDQSLANTIATYLSGRKPCVSGV